MICVKSYSISNHPFRTHSPIADPLERRYHDCREYAWTGLVPPTLRDHDCNVSEWCLFALPPSGTRPSLLYHPTRLMGNFLTITLSFTFLNSPRQKPTKTMLDAFRIYTLNGCAFRHITALAISALTLSTDHDKAPHYTTAPTDSYLPLEVRATGQMSLPLFRLWRPWLPFRPHQ